MCKKRKHNVAVAVAVAVTVAFCRHCIGMHQFGSEFELSLNLVKAYLGDFRPHTFIVDFYILWAYLFDNMQAKLTIMRLLHSGDIFSTPITELEIFQH